MTRRIVTRRLQAAGDSGQPDNFADRVVKYVPADVVAAWLALSAILSGPEAARIGVLWGMFALLLIVTPVWIIRTTRMAGLPPAWTQASVATVAFAVWVFATGRPFSAYDWYDVDYGAVTLIVFTLLTGLIFPEPADEAMSRRGSGDPNGDTGTATDRTRHDR